MFILSCHQCCEKFEAKTSRRMYCSQRCKDRGKPSVQGLTCCLCGLPMMKGATSGAQGEAAHNKCRVQSDRISTHGRTGYRAGCRCDVCKADQKEYYAGYRVAFKEQHGVVPNVARRKKFRDENGYWPEQRRSDWIAPSIRRQLYVRDNWTCHICNEPVDRAAHWNANYAPSLDHIIPQSFSAEPDHRPSNLRTAHRVCNSRRGASVEIYV